MRRTDTQDSKKRYFRAGDRIVNLNGAWYFTAREGDVGPYSSRGEAEREVQRFLLERKQLSHFQSTRKEAAPKPVPRLSPKPVGQRGKTITSTQQTRHHLDQMVESDGLLLTLDDDLLI